MNAALLQRARNAYHQRLVDAGVLSMTVAGVASNADKSNCLSCEIAGDIARSLGVKQGVAKIVGQTSGSLFEQITAEFVSDTFPKLGHLRPGAWKVFTTGNQSTLKTFDFAQYEHLEYLTFLIEGNRKLATTLGNGYIVAPDIVVYRELCDDAEINNPSEIVADHVSTMADLRKKNGGKPILHASISAKWTMRSDRAQNSRTEALNLIRNRKGRVPHIIVVTGEPLPSRIASLALGTGDIDCVYHFALYELRAAVMRICEGGRNDVIEMLESLIEGKRLRDISDLPLDLSC